MFAITLFVAACLLFVASLAAPFIIKRMYGVSGTSDYKLPLALAALAFVARSLGL